MDIDWNVFTQTSRDKIYINWQKTTTFINNKNQVSQRKYTKNIYIIALADKTFQLIWDAEYCSDLQLRVTQSVLQ